MKVPALKFIGKAAKSYLKRKKYTNFSWVVAWEMTYRCNLRCSYCYLKHDSIPTNSERALLEVIRLQPQFLILTGGEPLLVNDIDSILTRVKKSCPDPFMVLNSNLTVSASRLESAVPFFHTIHVSIDGLDADNQAQRGVPATKILDNLRLIVDYRKRTGSPHPQILTATIVTERNYRTIGDLVSVLAGIDPTIIMTFGAVDPIGHPMDLTNDPEKCKEFYTLFDRLKKRYRMEIVGHLGIRTLREESTSLNSDAGVTPHSKETCITCFRQYFRARVLPDGQVETCKPHHYLDYYQKELSNSLRGHDLKKFGYLARRMVQDLFTQPYNPRCYFPCKCEEFLDAIIMAKRREELPPQADLFAGRDLGERGKVAESFIRKHANPHFSLDFLKRESDQGPP